MKTEFTVPEVADMFKEIQQSQKSLFEGKGTWNAIVDKKWNLTK